MVRHTVGILIKHPTEPWRFQAETELDLENLEPEPPREFGGRFLKFVGIEQSMAELAVHSDRADDGFSHQLSLYGECYRFSMQSQTSLSFHAISTRINPNTDKVGLER